MLLWWLTYPLQVETFFIGPKIGVNKKKQTSHKAPTIIIFFVQLFEVNVGDKFWIVIPSAFFAAPIFN